MLTQEQINENKVKFVELISKLDIDITSLMKYLESPRVDFFNKPFNSYEDRAYAGSLCEHALKVYDELLKLSNLYYPGVYAEKDIIIVALLKDLYRAELYELYNRNTLNEVTGKWGPVPAYRTKAVRPIFGDIGFSSYMIARKFIDLTNDEIVEAICYSSSSNQVDLHNIRSDYKLVSLTTIAELAATYLGDNNAN